MTANPQQQKNSAGISAGAEPSEDENQYLTFNLGSEMYAIGILKIKEIIEYGGVTAVPMMSGFIRGVINLRGAAVPVVDLATRFGCIAASTTRRTCIVIIEVATEGGKHDVGVVVDAVSEVLDIPAAEIEPSPNFGTQVRSDFIRGMGKVNGIFVIILDVDKVLSVDEMAVLTSVNNPTQEVLASGEKTLAG